MRRGMTINSDMGEGLGLHSFGNDSAIMAHVDLANVACGAHAGDPEVMRETVAEAVSRGVAVGAHPGLPDLVGFGRREMKLTPEEVESLVLAQVGALTAFLRREGAELSHIKPHGSLYGMLARDADLMRGAAKVASLFEVPMLGLAGTAHETGCAEVGVEFVPELYVDLDYDADGKLLILRRPHPTDPAKAADRVRRVLEDGIVLAQDGTELRIEFTSICVHSDAPGAPDVARAVREVLTAHEAGDAATG